MRGLARFEAQRAEREAAAAEFERLAVQVPGVRLYPRDERITRSSFYRYIFAIEPEAFAGAGNERIVEALEAEGIPAEIQYPPMSRYELFQPSLSRLPVAVEYADRLDPANMSFPVAEKAALREAVYLNENIFRAGQQGIQDVIDALAKIQSAASEL